MWSIILVLPHYEKNVVSTLSKNLNKYKHEDSSVSHIIQNHLPTWNRETQVPLLTISYRFFRQPTEQAVFSNIHDKVIRKMVVITTTGSDNYQYKEPYYCGYLYWEVLPGSFKTQTSHRQHSKLQGLAPDGLHLWCFQVEAQKTNSFPEASTLLSPSGVLFYSSDRLTY